MVASIPVHAVRKRVVVMPTPTVLDGIPQAWVPTSADQSAAGFFVIYMWPQGAASATDVTYFRGVPTRLVNYTFTDPFTYASAVIEFPQISGFDALGSGDTAFLGTEDNPANVDIYWYAAAAGSDFYDPMTGLPTLAYGAGTKLWEGFIASMDVQTNENGTFLQVQCQGALYQLDHYKQKPFYPRRPYVYERLMYEHSYPYWEPGDHGHPFAKPSLRTLPLLTRFPAGWTKTVPVRTAGAPIYSDPPNLYTPVIPPTRQWTGFITRNTGSWDNTLTGFYQDMLSALWTTDDCGVTAGNQWALRCEENRQPVLEIRDRARTPDFELWYAQPGVDLKVSSDYTQIENALYGEGTGVDGSVWRNAFFTGAWERTDYEPLAAKPEVYPAQPTTAEGFTANPSYDPYTMVHESKTQFPTGVDLSQAETSSAKKLANSQDAGWAGTLILQLDPSDTVLRWQIRAGMSVKIKGFAGSGTTGVVFHIAEASVDPFAGTVTCKVDTKFRDLLTLEEARARNFDPMTPSKLLQVNRRTNVVEDVLAPWDYHAGSGYIPKYARYGKNKREAITTAYDFFEDKDPGIKFPWEDWTTKAGNRPSDFALDTDNDRRGPYAYMEATNGTSRLRWTVVPIVMSQKGTARLIQVQAYKANGEVYEAPFHISLYLDKIFKNTIYLPHDGTDFSALRPGAFESYDANGIKTDLNAPNELFIIGWGNADEPAGYSPGRFSEAFPATGALIDEANWGWDMAVMDNGDFKLDAETSRKDRLESITIYAGIYMDQQPHDVYFLGRIFRQEQGGTS